MEKRYISWEEIHELSNKMSDMIKQHCSNVENITLVAVARGGLIPAQIIAYKLGVRDVRIMKLASYIKEGERGEVIDISTDRLFDGKDVYFIDDLADSGETVKYIRNKYPNSYLCTLLMKDCCLSYPDFCVEDGLDGKQWVVFPWD